MTIFPDVQASAELPLHRRPKAIWTTYLNPSFLASRRAHLSAGALWSVIATIAAQATVVLTNIMVARSVGHYAFGEYCVVQNTATTVGNLGAAGIGISATRFVAGLRSRNIDKLSAILRLLMQACTATGALFTIALAALAPQLAAAVFGEPSLAWMLRVVAVSIIFLTLGGFQQGVLLGFQAFRELAVANFLHLIVSLTIVALLLHFGGLTGAIIGVAGYSVSLWAWQRRAVLGKYREEGLDLTHSGSAEWSDVFIGCAIPSALAGILAQIAAWISNATVAKGVDGFKQFAFFSAAFTLRQVVAFLPAIVGRVVSPRLYDPDLSNEQFQRSLLTTAAVSGFVAALVAAPLLVIAPWILTFFGNGYDHAVAPARLLIASAILEAVANSLYFAMVRNSRLWTYLAVICGWSTCVIAGAFAGRNGNGALAMAGGYVGAWLVACIALLCLTFCRRSRRPYAE
ncbi:MAG: oligosaccharide flippase family protein [Acidobacteriaceae bacterium]|nr:oligosaccharide flippase family protein [Acidobacteriaceae bacterium]